MLIMCFLFFPYASPVHDSIPLDREVVKLPSEKAAAEEERAAEPMDEGERRAALRACAQQAWTPTLVRSRLARQRRADARRRG